LLVSGDDTSARRGLRQSVELSLKVPDLSGFVRLITNHLHLSFFKSAPEVGALVPPALPGINAPTAPSDSGREALYFVFISHEMLSAYERPLCAPEADIADRQTPPPKGGHLAAVSLCMARQLALGG
jgi:hypothetical protein